MPIISDAAVALISNAAEGPIEQSSQDMRTITAGPVTCLTRRLCWWLPIVLFTAGCIATGVLAQTSRPPAGEITELELGKTVERQLEGGQQHEYHFTLQAGQYANLLVEPRNVRVIITASGPDGEQLFEAAESLSTQTVELIGKATGAHNIRIKASEATAPAGSYKVTLRAIEVASETHKRRVAGVLALTQAMALWIQHTGPAVLKAVE